MTHAPKVARTILTRNASQHSESGAAPAHLRIARVTKRFGAVPAVDGISLDIPCGAFATLLGPSGCGKTTLLRLIAGFYEPDAGDIYLNDRRINDTPAHRRGTAMVFQDYALFPHMTVHDNVAYGLRLAHQPKANVEQRVLETLTLVGLSGLGERWPNQLSGGQQQRVALARALVMEPEVLLLDEPLSNLDAKLRERMRWELRAMQQRLHTTFVYVTHDQEEALAMSDWVAVLNNGHVEQWGTPWDIYYHPRTAFLADFVGAVNLLPATVLEQTASQLVVALSDHRLTLPGMGGDSDGSILYPPSSVLHPPSSVLLCIRPESLTIGTTLPDPPRISLPGTVTRYAFLGHLMRYWVQVAGSEWIVDQPDPGLTQPFNDQPVFLGLHPGRVHVIPQTAE